MQIMGYILGLYWYFSVISYLVGCMAGNVSRMQLQVAFEVDSDFRAQSTNVYKILLVLYKELCSF